MRIAVYGSAADSTEDVDEKAREVGREIARRGCELVTGGCLGVPYKAVLGANELGGKCTGFPPLADRESHTKKQNLFPIEGFSKFIYSKEDLHLPKGFEFADDLNVFEFDKKHRNAFSVAYVHGAIFICGRTGTMNEFTAAYDLNRGIGVLQYSDGITKEAIQVLLRDAKKGDPSKIIWDPDPVSLVDKVVGSLLK